jgi:hypothetical protein
MSISWTGVHLGKLPVVRRTLFRRRCKFPGGATVYRYRTNDSLELNCSFLNTEYILIIVLKGLASIIYMCNLM